MSWMKRIGVLCVMALLGIGVGATAASAAPSPPLGVFWFFSHATTSNCLLMRTSAEPIVYPCMNYLDQEWYIETAPNDGPNAFMLYNENPNGATCLEAADASTAGLPLLNVTCDRKSIQQVWVFSQVTLPGDASGAGWQIQSHLHSGMCILGQYGATNMAITQYPCMAYPDQVWGLRQHATA